MSKTIFVKQKKTKSVSHGDLSKSLREKFPRVFQTQRSAKQIVDIVIAEARTMLIEQGRVCLRGIGTLQVNEASSQESGRGFGQVTQPRNSLTIITSWLMLDALNPDNPKYRYDAKRPYVSRRPHGR